jgi:predicted permease
MILYHLRHACRLLSREPGFAVATLLTLALGVGANAAVFAVVEAVLLRPLPYTDADRLVVLRHRDTRTGITKEFIAIGDFVDLMKRQTAFEAVAGYGGGQVTVFGIDEPFRVDSLQAGPGLLDLLQAKPIMGRALTAEDSRPNAAPVMLLGYDLWQNRFGGDPNIIGRGVKVGARERQVVGVLAAGFHFPPDSATAVVLPATVPPQAPAERKAGWIFAVGRVASGRSLNDASANLSTISRQMEQEFPQSNQGSEYYAVPLRDALVGETGQALTLLFAAVGVVMLIACANVANLMLARGLARKREMAVRMALGAGRARLAAQLLAESLVLAVAAGAVGVVAAHWGANLLVALVPASARVPGLAEVHINGGVLAFALAVSVGTAMVFGLVSALTVRSETASGALVTTRVTMGSAARRAASALVVAEVALAIVLLVGAGLILRSFARLLAVNPGFSGEHVQIVEIRVPADRYQNPVSARAFYDRAFPAVAALPGVEEVGAGVVVPLTGNNWTVGFERADRPLPRGQRPPDVGWQAASGGYFRALQIPLRSGRLFDARDVPNGRLVVIVSETIERRFFPGDRAVGRMLKLGDNDAEIVGVVGDIRRADLRDEPRADMYFPFEQGPTSQIVLFIRSSHDPGLPAIRSALRAIEPDLVTSDMRSMTEIQSDSVHVTRLALTLLGIFAVIALTLAAVGIYGVMSYVVRQRTREIGTRIALGATGGDIVWLVMRQGVVITVLGTIVGGATAAAAARVLASILFSTPASDPMTFATAATVLIATAMAACYVPARRAARVDPARTLGDQ